VFQAAGLIVKLCPSYLQMIEEEPLPETMPSNQRKGLLASSFCESNTLVWRVVG
jgi:hypothetical protein